MKKNKYKVLIMFDYNLPLAIGLFCIGLILFFLTYMNQYTMEYPLMYLMFAMLFIVGGVFFFLRYYKNKSST